jgi:hypothetical protein
VPCDLGEASTDSGIEVTVSGRKATGHTEPTWSQDIGLNIAVPNPQDPNPNGIRDGLYFVSGRCSNCTQKVGIIANSKFQSFIFAIGMPGHSPLSDSVSAPLRRHALYGHFSLDLTQAKGVDLPLLGTKAVGVASPGKAERDRERGSSGHALVNCLAFVIIFPAGIFVLRVLEKVNLHMYFQTFGLLLVVIGFASGLAISKTYNRVSAHLSFASRSNANNKGGNRAKRSKTPTKSSV